MECLSDFHFVNTIASYDIYDMIMNIYVCV